MLVDRKEAVATPSTTRHGKVVNGGRVTQVKQRASKTFCIRAICSKSRSSLDTIRPNRMDFCYWVRSLLVNLGQDLRVLDKEVFL